MTPAASLKAVSPVLIAARLAASVLRSYPQDRWKWHYDHGLFIKSAAAVGEIAVAAAVPVDAGLIGIDQKWVDHFVTPQGEVRTYRVDEFNLDQVNPGRLLFPIYRRTGAERYASAIHLLANQLQNQMRTPSGGYWHKQIYPNQMWLDGLYMAGPFHAEYAATFDQPDLFDDMINQFVLVERHTRDPHTGLLYHAWDESKAQRWANPETGCSPHFWGRAIGWYVMALIDVLDYLPAQHPGRQTLIDILNRTAQALLSFQDAGSGMWYQIVDLANRPGNYSETSITAMLVYGFAKGVRKGYLAPRFLTAARRAYEGLLVNRLRESADGTLALEGICAVGGLGGEPYRDGSFEYYMSEPVVPNDFKGVGPFLLGALEMHTAATQPNLPRESNSSTI